MLTGKHKTLIEKLLRETKKGNVAWEQTAKEKVFSAGFQGNFSVDVAERNSRTDQDAIDYFVTIRNVNGLIVDEYSDVDFQRTDEMFATMRELYTVARYQAMGVESALDDILVRLHSPEDDDIPF